MQENFLEAGNNVSQYGDILTRDQLREAIGADGRLVTIVGVSLPDIIRRGAAFDAALSEWVTGHPAALGDVQWRPVGLDLYGNQDPEDDEVLIEVSGVVQWARVPAVDPHFGQ